MKKILIPAVATTFLVLISCYSPGQKIKGSGDVIEEMRECKPFERIEIDGVIDVILIPGEKEEIRVEADDNLQPFIHVFTTGRTLIIDTEDEKDFKFTKNTVYVTFVKINEIEHDGVGSIKTRGAVRAESFRLESDGVGSTELEVYCDYLKARLDGVGSLKLSGKAVNAEIKNSGVGSINAYDLETETTDVNNSGVGSTEVFATKEISINSSGVGSVKYRGNAVIKDLNSSGVGSVKRID